MIQPVMHNGPEKVNKPQAVEFEEHNFSHRSGGSEVNSHALAEAEIQRLVNRLASPDGLVCLEARRQLAKAGASAAPHLLAALDQATSRQRWEIIKVLGEIAAPVAAPALVQALEDESVNVRWAAANALIALDRAGLKPLLTALTQHLDSAWLREGAHHVLHVLKNRGRLFPAEVEVYQALEGPAPDIQTPWAAEKVLLAQIKRDHE